MARVIAVVALGLLVALATVMAKPVSVPDLDLKRYAGLWYEIARFPNRFQNTCRGDVTAEYALRPDGRITVTNRCAKKDGGTTGVTGTARLADPKGPAAQLKVRFAPAFLSFVPQVWADYWVLGIATDYRYAVVGSPDLDYLWILSRTPQMTPADFDRAREIAVGQGFDVSRLVVTPQTARATP